MYQQPPHNEHRNCVKNDIVLKEYVKQSYEDSLTLAVNQGKMTNGRKATLLSKICKVANNRKDEINVLDWDMIATTDQHGGS